MKRIINGRRYNTEAKGTREIARRAADCYVTDLRWWEETLYRTLHGSWFLAGEGNAMTRWATSCVDGTGPGKGIKPLSAREAREWLENARDTEALEQYFADAIQDA